VSQNDRGLDFRQLNYQWLVVNLWRDNEVYSTSVEEQVIGSEEDAEETHDKEEKDKEEVDGLDSEYEY